MVQKKQKLVVSLRLEEETEKRSLALGKKIDSMQLYIAELEKNAVKKNDFQEENSLWKSSVFKLEEGKK